MPKSLTFFLDLKVLKPPSRAGTQNKYDPKPYPLRYIEFSIPPLLRNNCYLTLCKFKVYKVYIVLINTIVISELTSKLIHMQKTLDISL